MSGGPEGERVSAPPAADPTNATATAVRPSPTSATASSNDTFAWALAALPLGVSFCVFPVLLLGINPSLLSLVSLAVSAALVIADKRALVASGRLPEAALPGTVRFLVPPTYLFKRANRLGSPKVMFWVSIALLAASFVVRVAIVVAVKTETIAAADTRTAEPEGLPECDDVSASPDVLRVFTESPAMRDARLTGLSLSAQVETGRGPGKVPTMRYCRGSILASDDEEYPIDFSFEQRDDTVIIRILLRR